MKQHHKQSWPRPSRESHETACHFCDTLYEIELINEGEKANCVTCGQVLYYNRPKSIQRTVSCALAGMILFIIFLAFPFMQLTTPTDVVIMSVPNAVQSIWGAGGGFIAAAVAIFVIKILHKIQPWVMLEVFFLGIIVSLLKLVKLADVELLTGFWSLLALMICIAGAISGIDKLELWDRIEFSRKKLKSNSHQ